MSKKQNNEPNPALKSGVSGWVLNEMSRLRRQLLLILPFIPPLKRRVFEQQRYKAKYLKLLGALSILINAVGVIFIVFHPKRWRRFIRGQKKELTQLNQGEEDLRRFLKDSGRLLKDLFIPGEFNDHKPKILRPKSLLSFALVAIFIKLVVTGFLFFTYPTPAELSAIISSNIVSLINQARTQAGVEPLNENSALVEYAQVKGQDMINRDYFAHDTPEGKRPWQWINRGDYDYVYAGENLAMDFTSAEMVHDAFMKSPSHRRNILNPKYKDVGISVLSGQLNGNETILLVEFFGTQRKDVSTLATAVTAPTAADDIVNNDTTNQDTRTQGVEIAQVPELKTPTNEKTLAAGSSNEGVIIVTSSNQSSKALIDYVIEYSNILFIAFLIFFLLSLILNIFIKIRIQHPSVIFQSLVVIALLASILLAKFHFVEQIAPHILIL